MIRITNKPRRRIQINSDSDKIPIEISSDGNNKVDEKNKTEKKVKIEKRQILTSGRYLYNITLPVRYRDSQRELYITKLKLAPKLSIQKFEIKRFKVLKFDKVNVKF